MTNEYNSIQKESEQHLDQNISEFIDGLNLDSFKNKDLNSLEIECLNKVSECIIEMRAVIRFNLKDNKLTKRQLDFIYDSLDACHNIPRIISENHNNKTEKNNLDWLLERSLENATNILMEYKLDKAFQNDSIDFDLIETLEINEKESFTKLPYVVLGAAISLIFMCILGAIFYIFGDYEIKHNSYSYQNLEYLEEIATPDPKYKNEFLEQVKEYEK